MVSTAVVVSQIKAVYAIPIWLWIDFSDGSQYEGLTYCFSPFIPGSNRPVFGLGCEVDSVGSDRAEARGAGMLGADICGEPIDLSQTAHHTGQDCRVQALPEAISRDLIWVVIVAYDRNAQLERLLALIAAQTVPLAGMIVVDNADMPSTAAVAERFGAEYLGSATNLGGAGGFALGMLTALARGATTLWLWDDDGFPENERCLELLLECARTSGADVVSPLIVAEDNRLEAAFTFNLGGMRTMDRRRIQSSPMIEGFAHLFNGALVQAACLARCGLPDYRLFIRGDEIDFFYRVRRSGGLIVTCTSSVACHPSGRDEIAAVPFLPFGVVCPPDSRRRDLAFRNRAYVFRRHHLWLYLLTDPIRYGAFFLIRRRPDWAGYRSWIAATLRGYREKFGRVPTQRSADATVKEKSLS